MARYLVGSALARVSPKPSHAPLLVSDYGCKPVSDNPARRHLLFRLLGGARSDAGSAGRAGRWQVQRVGC